MPHDRVLFISSLPQIARIFRDRDRRCISRGWHRLHLHAASVRTSEHIVAATPGAAATLLVDAPKEKAATAHGMAGASDPAVAGAATADNAMNATRVRAEKAEGALRRQGGRLVSISQGDLECFGCFVSPVHSPLNDHDERKRCLSPLRLAERASRTGETMGMGLSLISA